MATMRTAVLLLIAALNAEPASAQSPATAAARLRLVVEDEPKLTTPRLTAQVPAAPQSPAAQAPAPGGLAPENSLQVRPPVGAAPRANGDPTVPDASIRDLLGEKRPEAPGAPTAFPEIRLRARVITPDKPASALIEIGGSAIRTPAGPPSREPYAATRAVLSGTYRTIREGDEFVIPTGDAPTPIRVVKLSGSEVLLEVVNRKTMIRLD